MTTSTLDHTHPASASASLPIPSAWHPDSRDSIRGESSGIEALDLQARLLAGACRTAARTPAEGPLLQQLARNGKLLVEAYQRIASAAAEGLTLSSDAEWLLDNFYIVEDVLREVQHDLPRGYYKKLPKLVSSPLAGYPRVYALALALIAHSDSSLHDAQITRFVQAFQTVEPLTIGELWAVPTMLRLGLLENLCRLAEHMIQVWDERRRAEAWVRPLLSGERGRVSAPSAFSPGARATPHQHGLARAGGEDGPAPGGMAAPNSEWPPRPSRVLAFPRRTAISINPA
jgi:cyclic beta-1,2-glucan synthetase